MMANESRHFFSSAKIGQACRERGSAVVAVSSSRIAERRRSGCAGLARRRVFVTFVGALVQIEYPLRLSQEAFAYYVRLPWTP